MATSTFQSASKRTTPLHQYSTSGDDGESSSSNRKSAPRRYRSLSRFSHRRMPDLDADVTPARNGKFVNTTRGSGFPEISLDDLAVEFFDSFSADSSGISGGDRERSGSRMPGGNGEPNVLQMRGRSVSRTAVGGSCVGRLTADTESSRRRRSVSRQPARGDSGLKEMAGSANSGRRRSVSRQPARSDSGRKESKDISGRANSGRRRSVSRQPSRGNACDSGGGGRTSSRRRRSLSVVPCRISDSESEVDCVQSWSNRGDLKRYVNGDGPITGSHTLFASDHRPSLLKSFSQNEIKYLDDYSSYSSAVTDDEKKTRAGKHGNERRIRTSYSENKATARTREFSGNREYGSHSKSADAHGGISTITKNYATKLQESEERKRDLLAEILLEEERGKELSKIVKELLTENTSEVSRIPSPSFKRSKDRSKTPSLTDEAEKYIEEFISNIEDTDFSSIEDERSDTSSNFGTIKTYNSQRESVPKITSVEGDGLMLPWLKWETSTDASSLPCLNKSIHTLIANSKNWDSDSTQDATSGHEMSIRSICSSRGSWTPCNSAAKTADPGSGQGLVLLGGTGKLKIDVKDYLKWPNHTDFIYESWKLRHRISSGSLVLRCHFMI